MSANIKILEGIGKIDSLKLKIDVDKMSYVDSRITSKYKRVFVDTGELEEEEHRSKGVEYVCKNGTYRVWIKNICEFDNELLSITLSAKLLKEKYFEGLSKDNIRLVYDELMNMELFKCSYEDFINGTVTDVDIAIDYYMDNAVHVKTIGVLKGKVKDSLKHLVSVRTEDMQEGIQFNHRDKASVGKAYIKTYCKEGELKFRSWNFWQEYLYNYDVRNLVRLEVTVKNWAMRNDLYKRGIMAKHRTLEELLEIEESSLKEVCKYNLNRYMGIKDRLEMLINSELTFADKMLLQALKIIVNGENFSKNEIIDMMLDFIGGVTQIERNRKSKARKRVERLLEHLEDEIKAQKEDLENMQVNEFISWVMDCNYE